MVFAVPQKRFAKYKFMESKLDRVGRSPRARSAARGSVVDRLVVGVGCPMRTDRVPARWRRSVVCPLVPHCRPESRTAAGVFPLRLSVPGRWERSSSAGAAACCSAAVTSRPRRPTAGSAVAMVVPGGTRGLGGGAQNLWLMVVALEGLELRIVRSLKVSYALAGTLTK